MITLYRSLFQKGIYICAYNSFLPFLQWVVPEVIGHAVVTVLMLISLHWFIFLLNLPVATWNIYR